MKIIICLFCRKEFLNKNNNQLFCSLSCKNKSYYQKNKEQILNRTAKRYELHKEEWLRRKKELYLEHKEHYKEVRKNRFKVDINYRLRKCLRSRIYDVLKGKNEDIRTKKQRNRGSY